MPACTAFIRSGKPLKFRGGQLAHENYSLYGNMSFKVEWELWSQIQMKGYNVASYFSLDNSAFYY